MTIQINATQEQLEAAHQVNLQMWRASKVEVTNANVALKNAKDRENACWINCRRLNALLKERHGVEWRGYDEDNFIDGEANDNPAAE